MPAGGHHETRSRQPSGPGVRVGRTTAEMLVTPAWKKAGGPVTAELFRAAGIEPGDTVVGYCHIGQQATLVTFAARRLGYAARLHDGSWDEWSRKSDLPVEKGAAGK